MLKLYGANLSSPSNKVRFALHVLGVEYEYVQVKLRDGEHRKEEFLKLNPVGKIPVIDDEGFVLFESNAIIKYLARKHCPALYPDELKTRAVIDQWMDYVSLHVGAAYNRVVFNRVFAPVIGAPVDEQSLKDGLAFLERFLPIIDRQLGKHKYLTGEELTVADINLLATLDPSEVAEVDLGLYENIGRWRGALQGEEFYTKCHSSYGKALERMMSQR